MESREGILVIGICDDDKSWVQTCKNTLMKFAAFINIDMEIKCFYTSKELLDYQDIPLDAVFLDIELGRQNGIMIAKKLNRIRPNCRIIYMTNYLHYATEIYNTEHIWFVVKKQFRDKIGEIINRILHDFENTFSQEQIVIWARQLAEVLVYMHGQAHPVIHRDIKPSNIMIKPDGNICLIDFNISEDTTKALSQDGYSLGYASPEQIQKVQLLQQRIVSDYVQVDVRSDIYSMGAVLYRLLTGRVVPKEYEALAETEWCFYPLAKIVDKCLKVRKEERYSSARDVLHDLMHLEKTDKEYRKLTLGTRLATAVCIFLVIISAMLVIYGNNLNAKDAYYAEYNIYQQAVEKQSDKAENLGLKLLNNKSYRSFYKLHPEEKAQILYQMGNLYLEKEQYEKASSYFQDSLNTGTSLLECYRDYAICSLDMGNLLKGKRLMNEAKEQGLSNAEYILVEGEMAFLKKEYRKALGDFKKAKETAADEEVRQKGASFYAKTCITLTDYQEAIKTLEAKGEYELADWMNLAFAYKCTGNWKKSKELLLQAVLYYPEDYRLYMRLCYLECELQDRKPQALKDYSQLKVYYDKAVSLLNGKTGNEEWIQLKSLIVQLKEYGWM